MVNKTQNSVILNIHRFKKVAAGTPSARCPRTDPSERDYSTGLLPRVFSEETHVGIWVHDLGLGNPEIAKASETFPCYNKSKR